MSLPKCTPGDHPRTALQDADFDEASLERAAAIFRALGDPGRLRILVLLARRQQMCVTDLATMLDEQVSTVSQRLRLLRSERLARCRRQGKHMFYGLADDHITQLVENAIAHADEPKNGRTGRDVAPAANQRRLTNRSR